MRSWGRQTGRVALYLLFGGIFLAPGLVSVGMLLSFVRWDEAVEWLQLLLFIPAAYLLRGHRKDLNASKRSTATHPGTAP